MFQKIKQAIDEGNRFLISTHVDPDGDAIGSAFALYFALKSLGKEASVYLKSGIPYRYKFLPRPDSIIAHIPDGSLDTVIIVDSGDLARIGEGSEAVKNAKCLINIDHHETNDAFGHINIIDERASSAAEVLYLIMKALDVKFDYNMAVNLYAAILTDTGSFRYDCTTPRAFRICEEMTNHGVLPSFVANQVYESHPKQRLQLFCLVLGTLDFIADDRIATAFVTKDMFEKTGTNREFSEGFVEQIKEIGSVEVACVFREVGDHRFKVSMRAKGSINVASVAKRFGGGGHRLAAGCTIDGTASEVKNKLLEALSL
jgi:bifunctional oligoribonuclease and PAP phosphatase NrnA